MTTGARSAIRGGVGRIGLHRTKRSAALAADFEFRPLWWLGRNSGTGTRLPPPESVDAVVIGAGFTGLAAAIEIARGGRSIAILDSGVAGAGASSRNVGFLVRHLDTLLPDVAAAVGESLAAELVREEREAYERARAWAELSGASTTGRVVAAHAPRALDRLEKIALAQAKIWSFPAEIVPRAAIASTIDSPDYHGALVIHDQIDVQPALLHARILSEAVGAGASLHEECAVTGLSRGASGTVVEHAHGRTLARDVVVATNAHGGRLVPWLAERLVQVPAHVIATETLPEALVARLLPRGRSMFDTRRNFVCCRPSPDGRRLVLAARTGVCFRDPRSLARSLGACLVRMFPDLADVHIARAWSGFEAFSFDHMAHTGRHDGLHFALGYSGAGIVMGLHLGRKVGLQVLNSPEGRTRFSDLPFGRPWFYRGNPWFLPIVVAGYAAFDWLDCRTVPFRAFMPRRSSGDRKGGSHGYQGVP